MSNYSEGKLGSYTSCLKINGVPLLPPILTDNVREEMQYYKALAVEVERRLIILRNVSDGTKEKMENTVETEKGEESEFVDCQNVPSEQSNLTINDVNDDVFQSKNDGECEENNSRVRETNRELQSPRIAIDIDSSLNENLKPEKEGQGEFSSMYGSMDSSNSSTIDTLDHLTEKKLELKKDCKSKAIEGDRKLQRQNSYTLEYPSPLLQSYLEEQSETTGVDITCISMSELSFKGKKRKVWGVPEDTVKKDKGAPKIERTSSKKVKSPKNHSKKVNGQIFNPIPSEKTIILNDPLRNIQQQQMLQMHTLIDRQKREQEMLQNMFLQQNALFSDEMRRNSGRHNEDYEMNMKKTSQTGRNLLSCSPTRSPKSSKKGFSPERRAKSPIRSIRMSPVRQKEDILCPPTARTNDTLTDLNLSSLASDGHTISSSTNGLKDRFDSDTCETSPNKLSPNGSTVSSPPHSISPKTLSPSRPIITSVRLPPTSVSLNAFVVGGHDPSSINRAPTLSSLPSPTQREIEASAIIVAWCKGYLTRRLMRTDRVRNMVETLKDALCCALELHRDKEKICGADIDLHRRLIQQITAACYDLHDTFITSTPKERCEIIAKDRASIEAKHFQRGDTRPKRARRLAYIQTDV